MNFEKKKLTRNEIKNIKRGMGNIIDTLDRGISFGYGSKEIEKLLDTLIEFSDLFNLHYY